jgi:hypothetical protein
MATKGGKKGKNAPDAIDAGRAQTGTGTATGQEARRRAGDEEVPKGKERGSTVKSSTPVPKADYLGEGQAPIGRQKEEAIFVANGQIDPSFVASPSGPIPVSAVTSTPEEAEKRIEQQKKSIAESNKPFTRGRRLSDEEISRMNGAELRAVAHDRGYDVSPNAGTRGTRAAFADAQKKDKNLEK